MVTSWCRRNRRSRRSELSGVMSEGEKTKMNNRLLWMHDTRHNTVLFIILRRSLIPDHRCQVLASHSFILEVKHLQQISSEAASLDVDQLRHRQRGDGQF